MRNTRILAVLGVLTLAFTLAALLSRQDDREATGGAGELMLPRLADHINDSRAISVSGPTPLELRLLDDTWVIPRLDGFPADQARVRGWLVGLTQLRRLEPKTRNPERYAELGLDEATAVLVEVSNGDGEALARVYLGKRQPGRADPGKDELYVRNADEAQTWLVEGYLEETGAPQDWLDSILLSLERDRIQSLELDYQDGENIFVERPDRETQDFLLAAVPADRQIRSSFTVNGMPTAFANLGLEDVRRSPEEVGQAIWLGRLLTFDGLVLKLSAHEAGEDELWVSLSAGFDGALRGDDEELRPAEDVQAEAQALNGRWEGWQFRLPGYQTDAIGQRMADLTEPLAEAKPEEAQPEEAQPEEAQPEEAQPEEAQPEEAQPEEAQPEEAQPEEAQPEEAQPEEAQPEEAQPEEAQPEEAQPEEAQPEEAQPEEAQPEEAQPEEAQPEEASAGQAGGVARPAAARD